MSEHLLPAFDAVSRDYIQELFETIPFDHSQPSSHCTPFTFSPIELVDDVHGIENQAPPVQCPYYQDLSDDQSGGSFNDHLFSQSSVGPYFTNERLFAESQTFPVPSEQTYDTFGVTESTRDHPSWQSYAVDTNAMGEASQNYTDEPSTETGGSIHTEPDGSRESERSQSHALVLRKKENSMTPETRLVLYNQPSDARRQADPIQTPPSQNTTLIIPPETPRGRKAGAKSSTYVQNLKAKAENGDLDAADKLAWSRPRMQAIADHYPASLRGRTVDGIMEARKVRQCRTQKKRRDTLKAKAESGDTDAMDKLKWSERKRRKIMEAIRKAVKVKEEEVETSSSASSVEVSSTRIATTHILLPPNNDTSAVQVQHLPASTQDMHGRHQPMLQSPIVAQGHSEFIDNYPSIPHTRPNPLAVGYYHSITPCLHSSPMIAGPSTIMDNGSAIIQGSMTTAHSHENALGTAIRQLEEIVKSPERDHARRCVQYYDSLESFLRDRIDHLQYSMPPTGISSQTRSGGPVGGP